MKKSYLLLTITLVASTLILSCSRSTSPPAADVLVTVNDRPIGKADVLAVSTNVRGHNSEENSAIEKKILENLILEEIISQKAIKLGLDADQRYQEELRLREAQVTAFKRKKLSEVYFRREIAGKVVVSDREVREYFAKNEAQIRAEVHIWQILKREESQIVQILNDLDKGASFEEVVARQFPALPQVVKKPWDLGYLKWNQVPEAWRSVVYNLKKGERSGIIRGPNNRFWIVKLIARREDPNITYEVVKPVIIEILKDKNVRELHEKTIRDLRKEASVVYSK